MVANLDEKQESYLKPILLVAIGLISVAMIVISQLGWVMIYKDAWSHLDISKRVTDAITPGLQNLGFTWLPLPHLFPLLFVWFDPLYHSGIAGSIPAMGAYLLAIFLFYKLLVTVLKNQSSAIVGASALMLNPNVLYVGVTPLTEIYFIVTLIGTVFAMNNWALQPTVKNLWLASIWVLFLTLSRYEGWALFLVCNLSIVYVGFRLKHTTYEIRDNLIYFNFRAAAGILGWITWGRILVGDWFYFLTSDWAPKSFMVFGEDYADTQGNLFRSLETYTKTVEGNGGTILFWFAVAGLCMFMLKNIKERNLPVLLLLVVPFPFYVMSFYNGQMTVLLPELTGQLWNTRYGLALIPAIGFFTAYLLSHCSHRILFFAFLVMLGVLGTNEMQREQVVTAAFTYQLSLVGIGSIVACLLVYTAKLRFISAHVIMLVTVIITYTLMLRDPSHILTLSDGLYGFSGSFSHAKAEELGDFVDWFRTNYDDGLVLIDLSATSKTVYPSYLPFGSRIPYNRFVYDGVRTYWAEALQKADGMTWVIMTNLDRKIRPDHVWERYEADEQFHQQFRLVYHSESFKIYKRQLETWGDNTWQQKSGPKNQTALQP